MKELKIIKKLDNILKHKINYQIIINGDVNGDGLINLPDIMKVANYIYKDQSVLSEIFLIAADFDNNFDYNLQAGNYNYYSWLSSGYPYTGIGGVTIYGSNNEVCDTF